MRTWEVPLFPRWLKISEGLGNLRHEQDLHILVRSYLQHKIFEYPAQHNARRDNLLLCVVMAILDCWGGSLRLGCCYQNSSVKLRIYNGPCRPNRGPCALCFVANILPTPCPRHVDQVIMDNLQRKVRVFTGLDRPFVIASTNQCTVAVQSGRVELYLARARRPPMYWTMARSPPKWKA